VYILRGALYMKLVKNIYVTFGHKLNARDMEAEDKFWYILNSVP